MWSLQNLHLLNHLNLPLSQNPPPTHTHIMTTRSLNNIFKPKQINLTAKHPLPQTHAPMHVLQAWHDPHWRQAMSEEFTALVHNGTWELVSSSKVQNLIGCKWIFRIKWNPDGRINSYKARLVAKAYHQRPEFDYYDTLSSIVKPTTFDLLLYLPSHVASFYIN